MLVGFIFGGRCDSRDANGVGRKHTVCEVPEVMGTWRGRGEGTEMGHNLQWAAAGFALGKGGSWSRTLWEDRRESGGCGEEPSWGAQAGWCLESGWF